MRIRVAFLFLSLACLAACCPKLAPTVQTVEVRDTVVITEPGPPLIETVSLLDTVWMVDTLVGPLGSPIVILKRDTLRQTLRVFAQCPPDTVRLPGAIRTVTNTVTVEKPSGELPVWGKIVMVALAILAVGASLAALFRR